ncbi:hypothetical protein OIU76_024978 [Salix suchowensis]|uniref:Uncharacterized protein n=1 Tax=Salix suchowensis TaxID=1278906 RepID=A0ABQ9AYV0_9ROSI|nr:hypothetical protein OIU76_024978 [Salix suchowensis]KAJ6366185.1 hypothetical protein OIU77_002710 [Salix suchowensis]KAJ6378114.1 hypothetical protein OIU78_028366 [Salix suchowensis]
MAGANFLERATDAEEWGDDDLELPPRHLPVEEVRDYKCGFPVTYISFPCHPREDCCDGGDDSTYISFPCHPLEDCCDGGDDSDKITSHSRPRSEGKLVKRRSKLSSSIIVIVKAITMLLIIVGMDI